MSLGLALYLFACAWATTCVVVLNRRSGEHPLPAWFRPVDWTWTRIHAGVEWLVGGVVDRARSLFAPLLRHVARRRIAYLDDVLTKVDGHVDPPLVADLRASRAKWAGILRGLGDGR